MDLFRYARDYYGPSQAQQLLWGAGILVMAATLAFIALHLLRRSTGFPVALQGARIAPGDKAAKYAVGARLYHWANGIFLSGLVISGIALFAPPSIGPAPWLLVHEVFAAAFVAGLLLHIAVAPRRGETRTMWFERRDWHDLKLITANFLGRTRSYPAIGKYDPWQKLYHAYLTLLSAAAIFSGIFLVMSAEVWATFSHHWMRSMRLLHDIAAAAFIAILIGHVYFGVLRVNWPQLKAMITGRITGAEFNRYHDAERWRPAGVQESSQAQAVKGPQRL
ncbi:MAG: cytochrome b/b6 domain-containing protein [Acidobacteria bacterium]|nr:cytochrome b/b6 domain-containing protein [Acidobacteriota bacterium]